ncbi:sphingosine 1-phosphate receptor 2-like isoform X2 [Lytechinus variegatus]|nr:sphingosine 1-phosphate receptor 2-like isoform X2 [Lytechinus variegatus]
MGDLERAYAYHSFILIFCFIGAALNLASMYAMLRYAKLRKGRHVFIFNLALSDCFSAIAMFIANIVDFPEVEYEVEGLSSWMVCLFTFTLVISLMSTLAIAVERLMIFRVGNYSRRTYTPRLSIALCVIGWVVLALVFFLLQAFHEIGSLTLLYCVSPCVILACIIVTDVSYFLIYKEISKISDNGSPEDVTLARRAKRSKYVIVTFALVVASTTACWVIMCSVLLVEYIAYFHGAVDPDTVDSVWFSVIADLGNVLVCINIILNPTIIWWRLPVFRRELPACCNNLGCRNTGESQDPDLVSSESPTAGQPAISFINTAMSESAPDINLKKF